MGAKFTVSYEECVEKCIETLTPLIGAAAAEAQCNSDASICMHYRTKYQAPRTIPSGVLANVVELMSTYNYSIDGIMLEGSGCSPILGQEILNYQFVTGGTNVGEIQAISASVPPLSMLMGSSGGVVTNHFYLPNSECTGSRKTIVYFKGSDANPGPEGPYYNLSCSLTLSGTAMTGGLMLLNPAGTAKELLWTGEYWVSMSCCPGDAR